MAEALGLLTPPSSPQHVDLVDEEWFPEDVAVLNWNIKFNKKPRGVSKPTQATKGIVAATLVIEHPALVLLQEVGWAPETGSRTLRPRFMKGLKKTWIQKHLIGKNKVGDKCDRLPFSVEWKEAGKIVLETYGFCSVQASFDHTNERGDTETFKASGDLRDMYIVYRKDLLQEVKAEAGDKSLMQSFSELLLKELQLILERLGQVRKTRTKHIGGLTSALESTFKKILGQAVCIALRSNRPRPGELQAVTFLAMSVHMPQKGLTDQKITAFGKATLRAACRLAKMKCLPLIIGGDWNVAVSKVHDAVPNLCLLNSHDKGIDGVFMYSDNTIVSPYEPYAWQTPEATDSEARDNGGDAGPLVAFSKFANSCYESNHMPILVKVHRFGTLVGSEEQISVDIL